MTRLDVKEQIPDQEVTSSKDSIYINVQSLKEYSRHIIAMANEFDRQKAVITKTELQMIIQTKILSQLDFLLY